MSIPARYFIGRDVRVRRKVVVKVMDVVRTADGGLDGRRHRLLRQAVPIEALEEPTERQIEPQQSNFTRQQSQFPQVAHVCS